MTDRLVAPIVSTFVVTTLLLMLIIVAASPGVSQQQVVTTVTQTVTTSVTETVTVTAAGVGQAHEFVGVEFQPGGQSKQQLIHWFGRANSSIHVMIYSFTLDDVADALISAKDRGVDVKVVVDNLKANETGSEYQRLKDSGVNVKVDTRSAIMNHKVAIIDGIVVITGSFNWSENAQEDNNENMIILRSAQIAGLYESEFTRVWTTWT